MELEFSVNQPGKNFAEKRQNNPYKLNVYLSLFYVATEARCVKITRIRRYNFIILININKRNFKCY